MEAWIVQKGAQYFFSSKIYTYLSCQEAHFALQHCWFYCKKLGKLYPHYKHLVAETFLARLFVIAPQRFSSAFRKFQRFNGLLVDVMSSGESRKFFLPVLCMPEAHNSGGSKIILLWLLIKRGKWVLDIHLSNHEILNALIIPNTLNFNEL